MKKLIIPMIAITCLVAPLTAANFFAQGEDGNLYVLADNGTYTKFEEKVNTEEESVDVDALQSKFLNQEWDSAKLIDLGNTLSSYRTGKQYTTGEFYLLEFINEDITTNKVDISGWSLPVLKTDKGTEVKGTLSQYSEQVSSSALNRYNNTRNKTNSYTIIFECPEGEKPQSIGIKTTDSEQYNYYKLG